MSAPLPTFNAVMNATAAVLLVLGYRAIRGGNREAHARLMLAATCASGLFLVSYLYYHFVVVPRIGHTPFNGTGIVRLLYFVLLVTHVVLAAVNLPMILRTLFLAHRKDWERHRAWARWTFPVWMYVSVTGVVVYLALYVLNPDAAPTGVLE